MTQPESNEYSYSRLFRKVIPSDSLRELIKAAADYTLGDGAGCFEAGTTPLVYAVDSLRVTQFERRVQAGTYIAELRRMHEYVASPVHITTKRVRQPYGASHPRKTARRNALWDALSEAEDAYKADDSGLYVRASRMVDCTKEDYAHLGTELALEIEDGEVARMLNEQTELITDAAMRTMAGKRLPRPKEPDNPRLIPIMHGQFKSLHAYEEFVEELQPELPVYEIGLGPIAKRLNEL